MGEVIGGMVRDRGLRLLSGFLGGGGISQITIRHTAKKEDGFRTTYVKTTEKGDGSETLNILTYIKHAAVRMNTHTRYNTWQADAIRGGFK